MHDSATSVSPTLLVETLNTGHPAGILRANHYRQPQGYRVFRPAGRRDWLLFFTMGGEGHFKCGEQSHQAKAGEITVIAPGTLQDYSTASTGQVWEFYWVHFVPQTHWQHWLQLFELWPGLHTRQLHDELLRQRVLEAFEWLVKDSFSSSAIHEELALNSLEQIILLSASQSQNQKQLDQRIETVLELMSQQLDATLNVSELARQVVLSPSRLAHLFKAQVGDSIVATHLKLRLRQAARLLEFTNRTIGEIALDTGFQNPLYFSRQFKSYYGSNPSQYRKQIQRNSR